MKCKICDKLCKSKEGLSNHIRYFHIKKNDILSLEEYYLKYIEPTASNKCANIACTNKVEFDSIHIGYKRHCSFKCSQQNPDVKKLKFENTKKAVLEKYGVDNAAKLKNHGKKVKATKLKRYGSETYTNSEKAIATNLANHNGIYSTATSDYKKKYKKTCLKKYGVDNANKSEIVKKKSVETCLERYGVPYSQQLPRIKEKTLQTSKKRYGGTLMGSPILSKKIKATNLERYGVENPMQNSSIKKKAATTNILRYGSPYILQNKMILQKLYGVDNVNQLAWVVEKQKKNRLLSLEKKYQVENVSQLIWVQDIIRSNNLKKYGVENPMQHPDILHRNQLAQSGSYQLKPYTLINGNIIHYQSIPELDFIKYCEKNKINISDGDYIPYTDINNKPHLYYVDFKIKQGDKYRLIEIKRKHKWFIENLQSGKFLAKVMAAQLYSMDNGYLPYKVMFNNNYKFND